MEEVLVDHDGRARALGSDGSWDGDRGEDDDEHHPRDDPKASHVPGTLARNARSSR
jgi:hypothetical protein